MQSTELARGITRAHGFPHRASGAGRQSADRFDRVAERDNNLHAAPAASNGREGDQYSGSSHCQAVPDPPRPEAVKCAFLHGQSANICSYSPTRKK